MYSPGQTVDIGDAAQVIDVVHVVEGIECIHAGIVHVHAGVDIHAADVIEAAHSIDVAHIHGVHIHVHVIDRSHVVDVAECIYSGHSLCTIAQAIKQFLFAEIGDCGLWQCLCGLKTIKINMGFMQFELKLHSKHLPVQQHLVAVPECVYMTDRWVLTAWIASRFD